MYSGGLGPDKDSWRGRKVSQASTAREGMEPQKSQEGRLLTVLSGLTFPVVIRPNADYHQYVGVAIPRSY